MTNGLTKREYEILGQNKITEILQNGKIAHIGMIDNGLPYVVPMNYGYIFKEKTLTLYLHSGKKGKKLNILEENPNVFVEIDTDIIPFEGKTPCQYGMSYYSIMANGKAKIIDDIQEKIYALKLLMKAQTNKDFEINQAMANSVAVIKIEINNYTAKHRPLPN